MEFYDNYGLIGDLNNDYIEDNLSINDGYESPYSFNFYDNYNKCINDFTLQELQNIQKEELIRIVKETSHIMIYYTSFKTGRYDKLLSLFFKDTVEEISNGWIKIKTTCEEFYTENYLMLENKDKIVYVLDMIIKFFDNNKLQHINDEEYDEFNKQFIAKFKV